MCAIIGFASCDGPGDLDWVLNGRDAMTHRGPDDAGAWLSTDGLVGLGHRRLAVIDLSPGGRQPMHDASGVLAIVFNGEIYNFSDLQRELIGKGHGFRSQSDTEVILAAYHEWGVDCLSRLNGMFAFALYDAKRRSLFLARDRAGEKPLYYALVNGQLRFASELKGLLADPAFPRRIEPEALDCYLGIGYVPGARCVLQGLHKLPPAHALSFDLDSGVDRRWCYWQLPPPHFQLHHDAQDELVLLDELDVLLEDAVRRQLVADVPVGVLLSGGVDSSLITAMAVRASRKVKTFTVTFPDFSDFDESKHARLVSNHFGTEHLELEAGHIGPDVLLVLARQYDEPIIDSSMVPTYLVSKLVRQHCTVALGGDGGDELFGGYAHYNRLVWTQERVGWVPRALRWAFARSIGDNLPTGFKGRNWLRALGADLNSELPLIASHFDIAERRKLLRCLPSASRRLVAESILAERLPVGVDLVQRVTRMDFGNYMPEDILVKVDRASMLNSLELRAPLLDYRIIEFAFGRVPTALKATSHQRKILLKKLTARLLPPEFDRQRKQGFSIPLADWLKGGPWRDFFHDVLLDEACIFDRAMVSKLLHGQDAGRSNGERLFGLVMFELWRREYQVSI